MKKIEITKETGVVVVLNTQNKDALDKIEKDFRNMDVKTFGFEYDINCSSDSMVVKVVQNDDSRVIEKKDLYIILSFIIGYFSEISKEFNNILTGVISAGEISIVEKSAKRFIIEHKQFPRIMLDDSAFSFINNDMINIYTEDREMNELDKLDDFLYPDGLLKIIKKDEFHFISSCD